MTAAQALYGEEDPPLTGRASLMARSRKATDVAAWLFGHRQRPRASGLALGLNGDA
jgi:hypothetical protein